MASIANDPGGRRRILFVAPDGQRKAIRLGKMSGRSVESIKHRVEQLLEALLLKRPMEADLAKWVADMGVRMANKLARVGLIPKPERKAAATLGPFIESYIARRADVSPHTRRIWQQTAKLLSAHFGADKPLAEITRGDAADWRLTLVSSGLADASVRKHCGFAKHFFAQAVDHELIPVNPFGKLVSSPVGNAARQYFVSREDTAKIIAAAPDAQWRLIIALSRYGGLRCPSEHLALTWGDVDWAGGKQGALAQNGAARWPRIAPCPLVSRTATAPGSRVRRRGAGHGARHHTLPQQREPQNATATHHSTCWPHALASHHAQSASIPRNRIGG